MRTTLSIDDDVLVQVKALAKQQDQSVGRVISELARRALTRPAPSRQRNGIPLLQPGPGALPVTLETVNALRDEPA